MARIWLVPVLASILILGTLVTGFAPNAYAAQGTITDVNPPGNHGTITEDGTGDVYQFRIPNGVAPGYEPNVGDKVTFTAGPGRTASDVTRALPPPPFPPGPVGFDVEIYLDGVKQFFTPSQLQSTEEASATQDASGTVRLSLNVVCDPFPSGCHEVGSVFALRPGAFPAGTTVNFKLIQIVGIPQDQVFAFCDLLRLPALSGIIGTFLLIPPAGIGDNVVTLPADEPDGIVLRCEVSS